MKVLGLGDSVFDYYVDKDIYFSGGNAYNFSVYARWLDIDSSYLGQFGNDDFGSYLQDVLNTIGVKKEACQTVEDAYTKICGIELVEGEWNFLDDEDTSKYVSGPVLDAK